MAWINQTAHQPANNATQRQETREQEDIPFPDGRGVTNEVLPRTNQRIAESQQPRESNPHLVQDTSPSIIQPELNLRRSTRTRKVTKRTLSPQPVQASKRHQTRKTREKVTSQVQHTTSKSRSNGGL